MNSKKLALHKTTIQKLDASSLKQIKGGAVAPKAAQSAIAACAPTNIDTCVCAPTKVGCTEVTATTVQK